jgi:hypothetical protein
MVRGVEHDLANALRWTHGVELGTLNTRWKWIRAQRRKLIFEDYDIVRVFGHLGRKTAFLSRTQWTKVRGR